MLKKLLFLLITSLLALPIAKAAKENSIVIDASQELGLINKKIFGSNLIAYDPSTYENRAKEYYGYSDYGAGFWDSKWKESVKEVVDLAKSSGMAVLRFPGGCGTHHYVWQNAIGKDRKQFLFGIDEFLKICEEVGAEPVITLSYFEGDEADKANLVEYLNLLDDGNHEWAVKRSQDGHKEPYGVKYFEVGNEDWHGDHRSIKKVLPEDYAKRYLKYYHSMKAVDPSIKIGAILYTEEWNKRMLGLIKDKIDFAIIHTYPSPEASREKIEQMKSGDIYNISLAAPIVNDDNIFKQALQLLNKESGKSVPLAITEFNGGFAQEKPVPYRHCLGTALINAELLRIFSKPENNILLANYWQFNNSYWGMISNGFDDNPKDLSNPYFKRPNYYVFEMYHEHFGDVLIDANVKCETYDASVYQPIKSLVKRLKTGTLVKNNLLSAKWEITPAQGVNAVEKSGVLEVEFSDCFVVRRLALQSGETLRNDTCTYTYNYYHSVKKADVEPNSYYKLSGYIKTEELVDENGVCLEIQDARGWTQTKSAASAEKVKGTTDWQYVEVIYETLPDAKAVNVLARRVGETGPLKGQAYFKDVKLEKFISSLDTKIPYLSVNASKSVDGKKVYLVVINKNMDAPMIATIDLKDFVPVTKGSAWVLNGPSVDATNEKKHDNVKVTQHEFEIKGNLFEFTFESHSLTAIEIQREN